MATYTANYAMIKPSYADIADVAAINQNTDTIDEIMHGSQTSIADAYDPAETYAAGDLAMHDFQLYKCNTDDTTGTWDPTKWERTTAAAEGGGGGGSAVSITPTLSTGTKIADFEIDGVPGELYAPTGGGGGASEIYDNTEKIVGTWFGNTLYEKSFNVTGLTCTTSDYFGSYSGVLDLSGYIGNYDEVFVDLNMSYLINSGGGKERFVLTQTIPNSTRINMFTCASRSNVSAVLTVKYTKATT